ncbi:hypothetical protein B0J14DRAFT_583236 [Halenospora varia]|nr:hypothetical protein B0J14DRAFT_583236 [Halenospora varia]
MEEPSLREALEKMNRTMESTIAKQDALQKQILGSTEAVENLSKSMHTSMNTMIAKIDSLENQISANASLNPSVPSHVPLTGLLRLPYEIRLQIYHYCIPRKRTIEVWCPQFYVPYEERVDQDSEPQTFKYGVGSKDGFAATGVEVGFSYIEGGAVGLTHYDEDDRYYSDHFKRNNSIFLLSKQISNEALDVLYGDNIFKLSLNWDAEGYLKKKFTEANRRRMRHMLITALSSGCIYNPGNPDEELWSIFLPALKELRIIAETPLQAREDYYALTLEEQMNDWIDFITPYLQCFGQHLSSKTTVEVDDDGSAETKKIFLECWKGGYREVRCWNGDMIFKRGEFSRESGYWDDD